MHIYHICRAYDYKLATRLARGKQDAFGNLADLDLCACYMFHWTRKVDARQGYMQRNAARNDAIQCSMVRYTSPNNDVAWR